MIRIRPPAPLPVGYRVSLRNVLGITFLAVLVFTVLGAIVVQLDPTIFDESRDRAETLLWFALLATTGILAATGTVLAWRTPVGWGIVGLTRPEPRWVLIAVAAGAVLFFVGERADHIFRFGIIEGVRAEFAPGLATEAGLLALFAARAVLLPLALEIYFRGVLLNFFVNRFGAEAGLFVASLLFAGLYFRPDLPISMAYGFIYGLVYGLLFLRSGSLWTGICAHATVGALIVAKAAWA